MVNIGELFSWQLSRYSTVTFKGFYALTAQKRNLSFQRGRPALMAMIFSP